MADSIYQEHHPRWLRPRMSTYWWLGKWPYVKFILRELSSVFVAWFVVYLLLLVRAVAANEAAFTAFVGWSRMPYMLTINAVAFLFIMFHAITWFNLAPKAIVAHLGKTKVPPAMIAGSNFGGWFVVSAAIWFLLHQM